MTDFVALAKKYEKQLIENRRWLHQHPEVGLHIPMTRDYIKAKLEEIGYEPKPCLECGLYVVVGSGRAKAEDGEPKCILLRADVDALPIREEADVPYAAKGENGHLCGHDIHASVALAVAAMLWECRDEIPGLVKIVFQPGEEQSNGAEHMVHAGIMENPKVHASLGMHVRPNAENGTIRYAVGPATAAIDFFSADFHGVTAHSSMPEKAKDPLQAAVNTYQSFDSLVHHEISAFDSAVLAVGMLNGGTAPNSIPTDVNMRGTLRSYSNENQSRLRERMREIVEHQSKMVGVEGKIDFVWTPVTMNDPAFCDEMAGAFADIIGKENIVIEDRPVASSDDFAFFGQDVPAMLFWFGVGSEGGHAIHHPKVVMEEDKLYLAAACVAEAAVRWTGK